MDERANVRKSLAAAHQALDHLARSLEASGFDVAVPAYRQLTDVVLGQRSWAEEQADLDLNAAFGSIGAAAARINAILAPFSELTARLAILAYLQPAVPAFDGASLEGRLLSILSERQPLSGTALTSAAREPSRRVRAALEALEHAGEITRRRAGGRAIFALARG